MNGKMLEEELYGTIPASQEFLSKITGEEGPHLGAIKINEDGTYQIYRPEDPTKVLGKPVTDYMQMRTGFGTKELALNLLAYGKMHEENHVNVHYVKGDGVTKEDEEFITELGTLNYLRGRKDLESVYAVAKIVNAYEYLAGRQMAKDLAELIPEIKEEAKGLEKYLVQKYRPAVARV